MPRDSTLEFSSMDEPLHPRYMGQGVYWMCPWTSHQTFDPRHMGMCP